MVHCILFLVRMPSEGSRMYKHECRAADVPNLGLWNLPVNAFRRQPFYLPFSYTPEYIASQRSFVISNVKLLCISAETGNHLLHDTLRPRADIHVLLWDHYDIALLNGFHYISCSVGLGEFASALLATFHKWPWSSNLFAFTLKTYPAKIYEFYKCLAGSQS